MCVVNISCAHLLKFLIIYTHICVCIYVPTYESPIFSLTQLPSSLVWRTGHCYQFLIPSYQTTPWIYTLTYMDIFACLPRGNITYSRFCISLWAFLTLPLASHSNTPSLKYCWTIHLFPLLFLSLLSLSFLLQVRYCLVPSHYYSISQNSSLLHLA